jgi:hypothetical protein
VQEAGVVLGQDLNLAIEQVNPVRSKEVRAKGVRLRERVERLVGTLRDVLEQMDVQLDVQLMGEFRHRHEVGQDSDRSASV